MSIESEIREGKKTVAVFGLGNIGGPIVASWLRKGAHVTGIDISERMISDIKEGRSHKIEPLVSETFTEHLKGGRLAVSSDGRDASGADIKIVAVPVALKNDKIDLDALMAVVTTISYTMKKGDAVVICPSLPPGTTGTLVRQALEENSGLKVEDDFFLIYSPERIYEGRALEDIEDNYPAIVSGYGQGSLEFADELFGIIAKKGTLKMSSLANAEAEKLFEGVYRDVNIALANELADYSERVGVDYWDVRKGVNSLPFCHLHHPGTGVGGLCIPVYPKFIMESSAKTGKEMRIIAASRMINDSMPAKCADDAAHLMKKNNVQVHGAKIAILGLGFRGEVSDTRLSPTYALVDRFIELGCKVAIHDPFVREDPSLPPGVNLSDSLPEVTRDASLVFVSADHAMYSKLSAKSVDGARKPILIFDGRNILDRDAFGGCTLMTIGIR